MSKSFFSFFKEDVSDLQSKNASAKEKMAGERKPGESEILRGPAKAASVAKHAGQAVLTPSKEVAASLINIFTPSYTAMPGDIKDPLLRAKNAIVLFGASVTTIGLMAMPPKIRAKLIHKLKDLAGIKPDENDVHKNINSLLEPIRKALNNSCINTVTQIQNIQRSNLLRSSQDAIANAMKTTGSILAKAEEEKKKKEESFKKLFGSYIFEAAEPSTSDTELAYKKKVELYAASCKDPITKIIARSQLDKLRTYQKVLMHTGKIGGNLVTFEIEPYNEKVYGHHIVNIRTPGSTGYGGRAGVTNNLNYDDLSIMVRAEFFKEHGYDAKKIKEISSKTVKEKLNIGYLKFKSLFEETPENDSSNTIDPNLKKNIQDQAEESAVISETEINTAVNEAAEYAKKNYTLCCGNAHQILLVGGKAISDNTVGGFLAQLTKAINDTAHPNPAFAWFNHLFFVKFMETSTNFEREVAKEVGADPDFHQDIETHKYTGEGYENLAAIKINPQVKQTLTNEDLNFEILSASEITNRIPIEHANIIKNQPKSSWGLVEVDDNNMLLISVIKTPKVSSTKTKTDQTYFQPYWIVDNKLIPKINTIPYTGTSNPQYIKQLLEQIRHFIKIKENIKKPAAEKPADTATTTNAPTTTATTAAPTETPTTATDEAKPKPTES